MPSDAIFKVKRKPRYTALSNALLRDKRLSFAARGLLAMLLSLPDDWEVRFSWLLKQSDAKRTALRRVIAECIKYGYMRRERLKGEGGRFQWVTEVYEDPASQGAGTAESEAGQEVEGDPPSAGFRPMENPSVEDRSAEVLPVENLPINEKRDDGSPKDERLSDEKLKATAAASHVELRRATTPPPSERVFVPNPFPVTDEMRAWAAEVCPLVNLDDLTDKFVIEYDPDGKAGAAAPKYSMKLWLSKWRTWMRREQKFEERDRARDPSLDADRPKPQQGGEATLSFSDEAARRAYYSACPDCGGQGFYYPEGKAKGVRKCAHKNMAHPTVAHVGAQESPITEV